MWFFLKSGCFPPSSGRHLSSVSRRQACNFAWPLHPTATFSFANPPCFAPLQSADMNVRILQNFAPSSSTLTSSYLIPEAKRVLSLCRFKQNQFSHPLKWSWWCGVHISDSCPSSKRFTLSSRCSCSTLHTKMQSAWKKSSCFKLHLHQDFHLGHQTHEMRIFLHHPAQLPSPLARRCFRWPGGRPYEGWKDSSVDLISLAKCAGDLTT